MSRAKNFDVVPREGGGPSTHRAFSGYWITRFARVMTAEKCGDDKAHTTTISRFAALVTPV